MGLDKLSEARSNMVHYVDHVKSTQEKENLTIEVMLILISNGVHVHGIKKE